MNIESISKTEKELYHSLYSRNCCETTGYWRETAAYIKSTSQKHDKLLDIGCGHGDTVKLLLGFGYDCVGLDISLTGLLSLGKLGKEYDEFMNADIFKEAALWDMPFEDNTFDYTFSFDVMEHLVPSTVTASIKEIFRITKRKTFHCLATVPSGVNIGIHKTVKPVSWWNKQFVELNRKKIECTICGHKAFLEMHDNLPGKFEFIQGKKIWVGDTKSRERVVIKESPKNMFCHIYPKKPKECKGKCVGATTRWFWESCHYGRKMQGRV